MPEGHSTRGTFTIGCLFFCRLLEVLYEPKKLYLIFDYLDLDLKRLMDSMPHLRNDKRMIKV